MDNALSIHLVVANKKSLEQTNAVDGSWGPSQTGCEAGLQDIAIRGKVSLALWQRADRVIPDTPIMAMVEAVQEIRRRELRGRRKSVQAPDGRDQRVRPVERGGNG